MATQLLLLLKWSLLLLLSLWSLGSVVIIVAVTVTVIVGVFIVVVVVAVVVIFLVVVVVAVINSGAKKIKLVNTNQDEITVHKWIFSMLISHSPEFELVKIWNC